MNYWCQGKEFKLLYDFLCGRRERAGGRLRGVYVTGMVPRMGPVRQNHISSLVRYFGNVNTNKHHEPSRNSSQIIIILEGRKIMVKTK